MNDTCPDCNQVIQYDGVTGDFITHDISPSMRAVCSGSGTPAPVTVGTGTVSNQPLIAMMQQAGMPTPGVPPIPGLPSGAFPPGFPGFAGPPPTTFDPPVKKPKRPSKVESLAKALLSDAMAPAPTKLEPPKPGEACSKHGLSAQAGVACGFCQMEYEQQQPVEFRADHATNQPKHMDGSPCTQNDQCPWSFTAWNALNTRLGQRELDEVVMRLSGAKENVDPLADFAQDMSANLGFEVVATTNEAGEVVLDMPKKVNTTGLPDDVAESLGLL